MAGESVQGEGELTCSAMGPYLDGELFALDRYHFLESTGSTNTEASRLAEAGAEEGSLVVADQQIAGRGRLGRLWVSPAGLNLYFSMVLRPAIPPGQASQLTLLAGVALAEVLGQVGGEEVCLKWPNDLLVGGLKVAGVLTEMAVRGDRVRHVVLGIGINVNGDGRHFPPELLPIATTLERGLGRSFSRSLLLAGFLRVFCRWYRRFLAEGFSPVREAWLGFASVIGRSVAVNLASSRFQGEALDLDAEGYLLVRDEAGTVRRVVAGDVSLI
ncbi:MAG: biotin--[acetyl-CoA-carboxylase] ligase [Magnetococcales bacterium]|nr:biotin--[acetyl-CoA-carboxylase] ligase [Magnetococcales bacterium]MBF0156337.1 biotin--[acetyl-CoA-carboxylase] ligase [Magnetococcales bacterium]